MKRMKIGDIVENNNTGQLYIIAQVRAKYCCLIGLTSKPGNRYNDPVIVLDVKNITKKEFNKLTGCKADQFTVVNLEDYLDKE